MKDEMDDFYNETGVHMNFVGASGNSDNLAKIKLGGGDQFDIVGVDALWVPKFYEEGAIEVFDFESWPQYADMFDEFVNARRRLTDVPLNHHVRHRFPNEILVVREAVRRRHCVEGEGLTRIHHQGGAGLHLLARDLVGEIL